MDLKVNLSVPSVPYVLETSKKNKNTINEDYHN